MVEGQASIHASTALRHQSVGEGRAEVDEMIDEQALDLRAVQDSLLHWRDDYKNLKLFGGAEEFKDGFVESKN